ncbi:Tn3 family transposase [Saccharopolyspora cebuensis]|uniref:Tn3 family transposase n=1 Tax=Saccharopolyspora cebuensis TaxID=418759 RepID=A0ABV4CMM9_9PSEU
MATPPRGRDRALRADREDLHARRLVDDTGYRRDIKIQANLQEGRHSLARQISHRQRGGCASATTRARKTNPAVSDSVFNAIVPFTTRYLGAAIIELRAAGYQAQDEDAPCPHRSSGTASTWWAAIFSHPGTGRGAASAARPVRAGRGGDHLRTGVPPRMGSEEALGAPARSRPGPRLPAHPSGVLAFGGRRAPGRAR